MADIARIVGYVASLDESFPRSIAGAEPAGITALESLCGQPLPADYREFLQRMGRGMAWLNPHHARFDIESIAAFYRQPGWAVPPNTVLIGRTTLDAGNDIYLASGRVVSFPPPEPGEPVDMDSLIPVAGSLAEMIGTHAFRALRMNPYPYGARFYQESPSSGTPEAVSRLLAPMGFSPLWFSNDWGAACEGPAAGAVAMKGPNSVLVMDCASASPELIGEIRTRAAADLAMKELKVRDIWRNG